MSRWIATWAALSACHPDPEPGGPCDAPVEVAQERAVRGVEATGVCSAIHGQSATGVDRDGDGVDDGEVAVVVAIAVDRRDAGCAEVIDALSDPPSDAVLIVSHAARIGDVSSDFSLFSPGETVDGADTSASVYEGGAAVLSARGESDGELRIDAVGDALGDAPFSGVFETTLRVDTSGAAAFDVDTDDDGAPDATGIETALTTTWVDVPRCAEADAIALSLALRAAED